MALEDIEKLKEKVDKDPNSKLFVPLAEEYRKEGMTDDAINVLLSGIERQPGYMSARVSLGKIYLEKGMTKEAQTEFENVIKSIPDNLYAHKKLADIYRDTGEKKLAARELRMVLRLNVMDEEALASLQAIESEESEEPMPEQVMPAEIPGTKGLHAERMPEEGPLFEEREEKVALTEAVPADFFDPDAPAGPAHHEDELSSFKDSLFGERGTAAEELHAGPDSGLNMAFESETQLPDEDDEKEISYVDIEEELDEPTPDADVASPEFDAESFIDRDVLENKNPEIVPRDEISEAAVLEESNRLISAGNYTGAMNLYRRVLSMNPNDNKVLQRKEELKSLLRLLGKDKEVLIERLNALREGITKRRDDFFRSP